MSTKIHYKPGFNWLSLLGVIFILCKIFSVAPIATWSWWLVLLPLYFGLAISVGLLVLAGLATCLIAVVCFAVEHHKKWQWERRYPKKRFFD